LVETSDAYGGFTAGTALGQGAHTGSFSNSSISGSSYVFGTSGEDKNGTLQAAGLLTTNSNGSVSGTLNWNDLSGPANQSPLSLATGTYTVDPTGRVTLTGLTDSTTNPTFKYNLQLYLTGDGHALLITMDLDDIASGLGFQQTGSGSFTAASLRGSYGIDVGQVVPSGGIQHRQDGVGPVPADGVGTLGSGFVDLNQILWPTPNVVLSGNFTASSSGVFTGSLSGINVANNPNEGQFTYYLVDTSRVVLIETDNKQLTLGYLEIRK
jgi:hypothetical protein